MNNGFLQGSYLATIATWTMIIGVAFLIFVAYITSPKSKSQQNKKKVLTRK